MFVVLEIQKSENSLSVLHFEYTDRGTAENKYHTVLAAAATSSVPIHSAVMLNEYGMIVKNEYYEHTAE